MSKLNERDYAMVGGANCTYRADEIATSVIKRKEYATLRNVIHAEEMPFEECDDGKIKHLVHNRMGTRECCVEAYMQFLNPGENSARHRHMWEEVIFVAEGRGYDLHWDLEFDCIDEFQWSWKTEPKKFTWERGDFIYVPPFTDHQHFNDGAAGARLIVISNRIVKEMGFDWFELIGSSAPVNV